MSEWLNEQEKEEMRRAIDAYEWKHSWHLPQNTWGGIDWWNKETIAKCLDVLKDYRTQSIKFANLCDRLVKRLEECKKIVNETDE